MSDDLKHPLLSFLEDPNFLETHMQDIFKKIMYPYTNYEDYEKYGDMFIKGIEIKDETKEEEEDGNE